MFVFSLCVYLYCREMSELHQYGAGAMSAADLGSSHAFASGVAASTVASESLGVSAWLRPSGGSGSDVGSPAGSAHSSPGDARSLLRAYTAARSSPGAVPVGSVRGQSQASPSWNSGTSSGVNGSPVHQGMFPTDGDSSSHDSEEYTQLDMHSNDDYSQGDSRDRSVDAMSTEAAKSYRDAKVSLRRVTERLGGVSGSSMRAPQRQSGSGDRSSEDSEDSY